MHLVQGARQFDLALFGISAFRQPDGHQPRLSLGLLRLNHEMRHALLERVDDDVRQLAVDPVGAADAIADLEVDVRLLSTLAGRAESTDGVGSALSPYVPMERALSPGLWT